MGAVAGGWWRGWWGVAARGGEGGAVAGAVAIRRASAVVLVVARPHPPTMIAPITGKLRKRFWLDVTSALGLGISAGYAFWYVFLHTLCFACVDGLTFRYGVHLKQGECRGVGLAAKRYPRVGVVCSSYC